MNTRVERATTPSAYRQVRGLASATEGGGPIVISTTAAALAVSIRGPSTIVMGVGAGGGGTIANPPGGVGPGLASQTVVAIAMHAATAIDPTLRIRGRT